MTKKLLDGVRVDMLDEDAAQQEADRGKPPSVEYVIPKHIVLKRLQAIGKFEAVVAIMDGDRFNSERWRVEGANVKCNDPVLVATLDAAGLTSAECEEVTARYAPE